MSRPRVLLTNPTVEIGESLMRPVADLILAPDTNADTLRAMIGDIAALRHTAVLYEAPSRVGDTLGDLAAAGAGDRPAAVARELTKQFEEFRRGTVRELAEFYAETAPRGEVVIVVQGGEEPPLDEDALRARALALRAEGLSARDVVRVLMEDAGAPRNLAYRLAHD